MYGSWVRHDAGCADGTQETIKKALAGVPGKLLSEKFVDFSTTRNWALRVRSLLHVLLTGDAWVINPAAHAMTGNLGRGIHF